MSLLDTAKQMIAHYNAQDVDAYVSLMTEDACEANYRGEVVREGKEGTRAGLAAAFERDHHFGIVNGGRESGKTNLLRRGKIRHGQQQVFNQLAHALPVGEQRFGQGGVEQRMNDFSRGGGQGGDVAGGQTNHIAQRKLGDVHAGQIQIGVVDTRPHTLKLHAHSLLCKSIG